MKHFLLALLLFSAAGFLLYSCAKYKDSKGYTDPRLTRPYCNDPAAVNYNDSFPGRPDDSTCIYPADEFAGTYIFHDSIYNDSNLFIAYDSLVLRIKAVNDSQFAMLGFNNDTIHWDTLTAQITLTAYVDTSKPWGIDTNTGVAGWLMYTTPSPCGGLACDTLSGTMTRDPIDTSIVHVSFVVVGSTGANTHAGTAYKQ